MRLPGTWIVAFALLSLFADSAEAKSNLQEAEELCASERKQGRLCKVAKVRFFHGCGSDWSPLQTFHGKGDDFFACKPSAERIGTKKNRDAATSYCKELIGGGTSCTVVEEDFFRRCGRYRKSAKHFQGTGRNFVACVLNKRGRKRLEKKTRVARGYCSSYIRKHSPEGGSADHQSNLCQIKASCSPGWSEATVRHKDNHVACIKSCQTALATYEELAQNSDECRQRTVADSWCSSHVARLKKRALLPETAQTSDFCQSQKSCVVPWLPVKKFAGYMACVPGCATSEGWDDQPSMTACH